MGIRLVCAYQKKGGKKKKEGKKTKTGDADANRFTRPSAKAPLCHYVMCHLKKGREGCGHEVSVGGWGGGV